MAHDDFEIEPVRGLPEQLPERERLLWQGAPDPWELAKASMSIHWVIGYFAALTAWRGIAIGLDQGASAGLFAASWYIVLGAVAAGLIFGTAWVFARDEWQGTLDYLFVDEAGQVALANVAGMSRSTKNLVLLGDQMQLAQPIQGSHPGESGLSALDYVMRDHATVPPELGIFLARTWRLHPEICRFISQLVACLWSKCGSFGDTPV